MSLSLARAVTPTWEQAGRSLGYPAELADKIARTGSEHLRVDAPEWKARLYRLGEVDFQRVDFRAREERVRDLGRALLILMTRDPLADRWVAWQWQNWAFGHRQLIPIRGAETPAWRHSYADFVHRLKHHPVDPPDWLDRVQFYWCSRSFGP